MIRFIITILIIITGVFDLFRRRRTARRRAYIDQIWQKASLDEGIQVSNKESRLFKTEVMG